MDYHYSDMNDTCSVDDQDTSSNSPCQGDAEMMKRRSFSHDYLDSSGDGAQCAPTVDFEVNSSSASSSAQEHEHDSSTMPPTPMEHNASTLQRRHPIISRPCRSYSMSERQQRRRTQEVDMPTIIMGGDTAHTTTSHVVTNRARAHTCPQHQFHHHDSDEELEDSPSAEDEESGRMSDENHHVHGGTATEPLPSSSLFLSSQNPSISSHTTSLPAAAAPAAAAPSPRRRAASTPSIIVSPFTPTLTSSIISNSHTTIPIKHTLLKLLMLISIYQLLSYTYNTGLSPDVKYKLNEINYDIEEYWYGGRLWSSSLSRSSTTSNNRLSALRIVGSSGISFNDDYGEGVVAVEEEGEGIGGFFAALWSEKFGGGGNDDDDDEGGVVVGRVDGGEGDLFEEIAGGANIVKSDARGEAGEVDSTAVEVDSTTETSSPNIIVANSDNKNMTKRRRPAMAHVMSISDNRHPFFVQRASPSRRMKTTYGRNQGWTLSRIAGAIIWIGLMIPILELGIRAVSRRFRLGSLLRSRLRILRRRGLSGGENVHIL